MTIFNVELRPHLAQARHPLTGVPLTDADGKPVPLFPNQRSIWVDGVFVGYVCEPPARTISLTRPIKDAELLKGIKGKVDVEFNSDSKVTVVPDKLETESDDD